MRFRISFIDRPLSFELMADDIAALIKHLGLDHADLFGFSLGGGRCGKGRWVTIESFKHSKGQRERRLGHKLSLLLAIPPVFHLLLNLLRCLSKYLLLLVPFLYRRQKPLLFPLRLLCWKPRSPVPVVFSVGANDRPHGIG